VRKPTAVNPKRTLYYKKSHDNDTFSRRMACSYKECYTNEWLQRMNMVPTYTKRNWKINLLRIDEIFFSDFQHFWFSMCHTLGDVIFFPNFQHFWYSMCHTLNTTLRSSLIVFSSLLLFVLFNVIYLLTQHIRLIEFTFSYLHWLLRIAIVWIV